MYSAAAMIGLFAQRQYSPEKDSDSEEFIFNSEEFNGQAHISESRADSLFLFLKK